jgi:uncharacterized membrane protein
MVPQGALGKASCLGVDHRGASIRSGQHEGLSMIRKFALAFALTFAASLIVQIAAVSQASAGKTCTYTSSDKKKGYKC